MQSHPVPELCVEKELARSTADMAPHRRDSGGTHGVLGTRTTLGWDCHAFWRDLRLQSNTVRHKHWQQDPTDSASSEERAHALVGDALLKQLTFLILSV
jgi:hypothetical protein